MKTDSTPETAAHQSGSRVQVIGVGGAGSRLAEGFAVREPKTPVVVVDSDTMALRRLANLPVLAIGADVTRGLGCGGDVAHACAAAEGQEADLRELVAGAGLVFLLAGLGGGIGSGLTPMLAKCAREAGALVVVLAVLPFDFEGNLRQVTASQALRTLKSLADVVIALPNQAVVRLAPPATGAVGLLELSDGFVIEVMRGLGRLVSGPALVSVGLADLKRALPSAPAGVVAVCAAAAGEQRVRNLWRQLEEHPFLPGPDGLAGAETVLLHVTGGRDLQLEELEWLQTEARRRAPRASVLMGAAADASSEGRLAAVMIVVSVSSKGPASPTSYMTREPALSGTMVFEDTPSTEDEPIRSFAPTTGNRSSGSPKTRSGPAGGRPQQQQQFDFAAPWRGRFENAEATLRNGENLDEPTFARRGVKLN